MEIDIEDIRKGLRIGMRSSIKRYGREYTRRSYLKLLDYLVMGDFKRAYLEVGKELKLWK